MRKAPLTCTCAEFERDITVYGIHVCTEQANGKSKRLDPMRFSPTASLYGRLA